MTLNRFSKKIPKVLALCQKNRKFCMLIPKTLLNRSNNFIGRMNPLVYFVVIDAAILKIPIEAIFLNLKQGGAMKLNESPYINRRKKTIELDFHHLKPAAC